MKERITPLTTQEKIRLQRLCSNLRWHTHKVLVHPPAKRQVKKFSHSREMEYRLYQLFHD